MFLGDKRGSSTTLMPESPLTQNKSTGGAKRYESKKRYEKLVNY